jgi:hypothetical protein
MDGLPVLAGPRGLYEKSGYGGILSCIHLGFTGLQIIHIRFSLGLAAEFMEGYEPECHERYYCKA